MENKQHFEVIIMGGSYAGLSAGLALGRALRKVLIIDGGKPCNLPTPYSHNFLTQDGKTPHEISAIAKEQVARYETVQFLDTLAVSGSKIAGGFAIETQTGDIFTAKKIIFATGIRDMMPAIEGFAACWGVSILHCPYCHGYEVRNEKTGIIGNGDYGFEFSKFIHHWTKDLVLFTQGAATLTQEQTQKLAEHHIPIIEKDIERLEHHNGYVESVVFRDGSVYPLKAIYTKVPFEQSTPIPVSLGCNLTEQGYLQIDAFQRTNVEGVFACGDNTTPLRSVANAVAMGTLAGTMANKALIDEDF